MSSARNHKRQVSHNPGAAELHQIYSARTNIAAHNIQVPQGG